MTPDVLGLELADAQKALRACGINEFEVIETSSRKGVPNADALRVLRVRMRGEICCELVVAKCRCRIIEAPTAPV